MKLLSLLTGLALLFAPVTAFAQTEQDLAVHEGDVTLKNFRFGSGEKLDALKIHYRTLGSPRRDKRGRIINAVMVLHGTGGDGTQFLRPQFAGILFRKDGLLDPAHYYIILPDGIGHGDSSKPSDGLRAKFPKYDYDDMVRAQYEMLRKLKVDHLRLLMGTSMGCMHSFVWAETYPKYMDAALPLACLPVEIAGRNRMWRKMLIDAITTDPDWQSGNYAEQPAQALRTASSLLAVAGSAPLYQQMTYPDRGAADKYVETRVADDVGSLDANDLLYAVSASRNYDPSGKLGTIKTPMIWINSADDFINPPELGIAEAKVKEIPNARFILLPISEQTRGHGTHTWAALWMQYLEELLDETEHSPTG